MKELFEYKLLTVSGQDIMLGNVFIALAIAISVPILFSLFTRTFLKPYFKRKNIEEGRAYSVTQLIKYVVYLFTFLVVVQAAGFQLSVIWAAGAALLVGLGIGLQHFFNDLASGVILLIEGSVEKGDWIEIGDMQGEIKKIGLRTSILVTRRNISIIVPNSKITVENVVNLSYNEKLVRHSIKVGVSYDSSAQLVKKILLECANRHNKVEPDAFVRLVDFGDSAIVFELLFFSSEYFRIDDVRSDLRFMIDIAFRKNNIKIPFPQRDLHLKNTSVNTILKTEENKLEQPNNI